MFWETHAKSRKHIVFFAHELQETLQMQRLPARDAKDIYLQWKIQGFEMFWVCGGWEPRLLHYLFAVSLLAHANDIVLNKRLPHNSSDTHQHCLGTTYYKKNRKSRNTGGWFSSPIMFIYYEHVFVYIWRERDRECGVDRDCSTVVNEGTLELS